MNYTTMKLSVLFILSVFTVMQACEGKVSVKPGFTKNLLDVIGNWLGIGQTNMGDWYQWSHQCNWPLIKNIVLNCPTSSPSSDVELDPKSDTQAKAALEKFSVENWDRATVAKMTFQQRSDLFKPCFDNEHNFLLCTQRSWTILGMDMCEVWHHANQ
ncbi:hypothetical protein KVV02_004785 [Mortierella alpina]|uniref:Secreted protein n=1 Tax=Mortierella alpina TaxID=64518 RepID=A0A9P8CXJ6_MORAP|nr:hypothetical protein KVV02_004785 [Mortierella alpina]